MCSIYYTALINQIENLNIYCHTIETSQSLQNLNTNVEAKSKRKIPPRF